MIIVNYGKDIIKNTYDALAASDIASYLEADDATAIKPNLVNSRPADEGSTTHPEVVEGIIRFLNDFGVKKIKIIESSQVGTDTKNSYKRCGYDALARKYQVPLIDLKSDTFTALNSAGYDIKVYNEALNTDFLINVPVLKAHCQTSLTCCMKNLKGCIPDSEKQRFHSLGIHKPVAAVNAMIKTGYCVVDGICGDLSFEEGGNPVVSDRIIAGRDPLLIDSFCAELIGYQPDEIGYLAYGKKLGIGEYFSEDTEVIELNTQNKPAYEAKSGRSADRYKKYINEDAACSACYSSLIYALHRLGGRPDMDGKISIGQGFRGKSGSGFGVGNCTRGFARCVAGCPPKAVDIIAELKT